MRKPWLYGRAGWGAASALAALLLALSGPVSAQALTGIANTKHNLGSGAGPADRNQTDATAEICVFCHTPHGGSTDAPVPLWNKRLGSNGTAANGATYTTYASLQTPSLDGTVAEVGSISVACLSCHDGTQAMDNVINAPGSGGVLDNGGGNDGRAWAWTGATVDNVTGKLTSGPAALGTDLSNDHPIGIQYCGGGLTVTNGAISGNCKDSDFTLPQTQVINGNQIFMEGVDDFVMIKDQRRVAIPYLGTMVFRDGLISEWRDYFDRGLFDRLKAGEAPPPDIAALADRPGVP